MLSSPVSEECSDFSNRGFPPSSGRQPRAMAIAHIVLGVSYILFTSRVPMPGTNVFGR